MWDETTEDVVDGRDPGLARERTELAWNRSGLAVVVAASVLVRRLWPLDGYKSGLALGAIALGAAVWGIGMRLTKAARPIATTEAAMAAEHCRLLTIGTLFLALAGFVVGLVLPT